MGRVQSSVRVEGETQEPARRGRRRISGALLVGCLLLGPLLPSAVAAAARPETKRLSPVQQGLAFYRGKTVTVIVAGTVGGPYDLFARALQPYLAAYLHASVNLENITIGGSGPAENDVAAAKPDGLTAGLLQLFTPIAQVLTGQQVLNFNVTRLAWIAAMGATPLILVASPSSGFTNIAQVVHAPQTVRAMLGGFGSQSAIYEQTLLGLLHARIQFITGYNSTAQELVGFQRGDAPLVMLGPSTIGSFLASGQAVGLVTTLVPSPGAEYRAQVARVPTFADVFKEFPPKTAAARAAISGVEYLATAPEGLLALQTGVAGDKVAAMRAAVVWAFKQPSLRPQLTTDGEDTSYIDPLTAKAAFAASVRNERLLSCYVQSTC